MHPVRLTLFVNGLSPRTESAVGGVGRYCAEHLEGKAEVELVNVEQDPARAAAMGVRLTPTLVHQDGPATRMVFGDLSDAHEIAWAIGLRR